MNILDRILATKRDEVALAKAERPIEHLIAAARSAEPARGFRRALLDPRRSFSIIAEVKRASPSKGVIRADWNPVAIAESYAEGGAAALSVLTDETYFQGHLAYIAAIRARVPLPILRKDFIIDAYQVWEARAAGADAILLILSALGDDACRELALVAAAAGVDVLWEVHDAGELERVLALGPELVGVNNRDLKSFEVSLETTRSALERIPRGIPVISESGFSTSADLRRALGWGVRGFLIGESLMRERDPGAALAKLIAGV
jgi:indole-3-glycerol phosphate synthase